MVTPQFFSRIGRVVVFQPLDEAAMTGIAERQLERICEAWQRRREKLVEVAHELIVAIGRQAHTLNSQSGGQEGGRSVRRLISDWVESRIQQAGTEDPEAYRECRRIVLSLAKPASVPTGDDESVQEVEVTANQVLVELVREEAVFTDS